MVYNIDITNKDGVFTMKEFEGLEIKASIFNDTNEISLYESDDSDGPPPGGLDVVMADELDDIFLGDMDAEYVDRSTAIKGLKSFNEVARKQWYFKEQMCLLIKKYPEEFGFRKSPKGRALKVTSRQLDDNKVLYRTWVYSNDIKTKASKTDIPYDAKAFDDMDKLLLEQASKIADKLIKEEIIRRGDSDYRLFEVMGFSYEYKNGELYVWLVN